MQTFMDEKVVWLCMNKKTIFIFLVQRQNICCLSNFIEGFKYNKKYLNKIIYFMLDKLLSTIINLQQIQ